MKTLRLNSEEATGRLAETIAGLARVGDVIALYGDLGAGKTTFARRFIQARGGTSEVPSPTFTLVQIYDLAPLPIYHFDLYRLESAAELEELGMEEAFSDGISLIEWPERAEPGLPANRLDVRLAYAESPTVRRLQLTGRGDWIERLKDAEIDA